MLIKHGLEDKILTFNADNASNNDTQTVRLSELSNSFESVNRIRCFNHTMQLAVRGLLKALGKPKDLEDGAEAVDDNELMSAALDDDDDDEEDGDGDGEGIDDTGDEEEPLETLTDMERDELMENTEAARGALQKVSFALHD
jgi:hypothetical protein